VERQPVDITHLSASFSSIFHFLQIIMPARRRFFTGKMIFLTPNQQCESSECKKRAHNSHFYVCLL